MDSQQALKDMIAQVDWDKQQTSDIAQLLNVPAPDPNDPWREGPIKVFKVNTEVFRRLLTSSVPEKTGGLQSTAETGFRGYVVAYGIPEDADYLAVNRDSMTGLWYIVVAHPNWQVVRFNAQTLQGLPEVIPFLVEMHFTDAMAVDVQAEIERVRAEAIGKNRMAELYLPPSTKGK